LLLSCSLYPQCRPPFPTRRSSDLLVEVARLGAQPGEIEQQLLHLVAGARVELVGPVVVDALEEPATGEGDRPRQRLAPRLPAGRGACAVDRLSHLPCVTGHRVLGIEA